MKFPSGRLKKFNYNITRTIDDAKNNQELIALGDSQALRTIRSIRYEKNPKIIQYNAEKLTELQYQKKKLSKEHYSKENYDKINEINDEIDEMLYVPECVSVVFEDDNHYKEIISNKLYINDKQYVRLMCSASHARVNTVIFIQKDFEKDVKKRLMTGKKDIDITDSKYNAYFALSSSSTYEISTPRVLLIDDCEIQMTKRIDWISKVESPKKLHNKEKVDEVEKELTFNLFDGCGAISPEFSKRLARELEVDYLPSGFCIRCSYIKGMVFVVDFKQFAKEHGITVVKDIYGVEQKIEDIDIVLTKSQFKLYNAYDSIENYRARCDENGIRWGVTRVTPKQDDDYFRSNYQFCQVLNLNDNDVEDLCKPTVDWIKNVAGGDVIYSLLYLLGNICDKKDIYVNDIFKLTNDNIVKALILNPAMIQDEYIKRTIIHSINKKIRESYVGKLILDGNFNVMIPDMVAFMQWMCGEDVSGALKEFEHYSRYWNQRGAKNVVAMRSPLTWRSEVNKLTLIQNELTEKWFKYLTSGIVYNVWGCDCMRHADSDWDGDLSATTNNPIFLNCHYDGLPITYEKLTVSKGTINEDELYKADIRAFNSVIGKITNDSTTNYEILAKYEGKPEYQNYTDELIERLKLTRKLQGDSIDKAKGIKVGKMPTFWMKKTSIKKNEDVDDKRIDFLNEIISDRKPYFFRYLYYKQYIKYRDFINNKNKYCLTTFGKNLDEILSTKELNEVEKAFIDEFYKYIPLIDNGGPMNRICQNMERELKELSILNSYRTPNEIIVLMQSGAEELDATKLAQMFELYKKYNVARKKYKKQKGLMKNLK